MVHTWVLLPASTYIFVVGDTFARPINAWALVAVGNA